MVAPAFAVVCDFVGPTPTPRTAASLPWQNRQKPPATAFGT